MHSVELFNVPFKCSVGLDKTRSYDVHSILLYIGVSPWQLNANHSPEKIRRKFLSVVASSRCILNKRQNIVALRRKNSSSRNKCVVTQIAPNICTPIIV